MSHDLYRQGMEHDERRELMRLGRALRRMLARIEWLVDGLIDEMDGYDGDTDREPDADREPGD